MSGERIAVGVDLGGTKILTIAMDAGGKVLGRSLHPTPHEGEDVALRALATSVEEAMRSAGLTAGDVAGVAVGAPGPMDPDTGVLLEPPNLPGCRNLPIRSYLQERLKMDVRVENDANVAAIGEYRFGAGRGVADMVYVTVSTGIGGGVMVGGRLMRGAGRTAGEIGHMVLAHGQEICPCGRSGCWEAICSGTAIAHRAQEAVAAGRASPGLVQASAKQTLTAPVVLQAAAGGDPTAQAILARVVEYNGVGLMNLLHLFSPGMIVIGGGLTHAWDTLIAPAVDWAKRNAFQRPAAVCHIVRAELEDMVGAVGAAALALDPDTLL